MDDDVYGSGDCGLAQDLVLGVIPIIGDLGKILMADDNQQVIIRLIAILGLIDPIAARIAAEQDDLADLAVLLPLLRRARDRDGKSSINIRVASASSSCCAGGR
nr:hypothetical protein [Sphingopyxis solisilvae]